MRNDSQAYREARKRILAPDPLYCGICGEVIDKTLKYPDPGSPTVDHVIPISKGGHMLRNLRPAHASCNKERQNRPQREETTRHCFDW